MEPEIFLGIDEFTIVLSDVMPLWGGLGQWESKAESIITEFSRRADRDTERVRAYTAAGLYKSLPIRRHPFLLCSRLPPVMPQNGRDCKIQCVQLGGVLPEGMDEHKKVSVLHQVRCIQHPS